MVLVFKFTHFRRKEQEIDFEISYFVPHNSTNLFY